MRKVIPNREFVPERIYIQRDKFITVYSIGKEISALDCEYETGAKLFEFELPTKEAAEIFMNDLYYGEYTGG